MKRFSLFSPVLALPLLFTAFACSSATRTVGPSAEPDGGLLGDPGRSASDDGGVSTPQTPKGACEALIACVADVEPTSAGPLVTLYGDASNCWKGSAADAEACGKACAKSLDDRKECMAAPLDRHYLALCDSSAAMSGEPLRYDVDLRFHARTGGEITFRPLPLGASVYRASDALMSQPTIRLAIKSGGGEGATSVPFEVPAAAFDDRGAMGPGNVKITEFGVKRLRIEKTVVCSELDGTVTVPFRTELSGACVYLPLADGAPIPRLSRSEITSCDVSATAAPSGGGSP